MDGDDALEVAYEMLAETQQPVWAHAREHRPSTFRAYFERRYAALRRRHEGLWTQVMEDRVPHDDWRCMRELRAQLRAGRITQEQANAAMHAHLDRAYRSSTAGSAPQ